MTNTRKLKLLSLILFVLATASGWAVLPNEGPDREAGGQPLSDDIRPSGQTDLSRFQHGSAQHARMPCLLCHKREAGLFTPKMPGHTPCSGCHVQQFADNQSAICNICHTANAVKRFPPLRSFNVTFNHSIHGRQTTCATCHRPVRAGQAFSIPSGATAHQTCFRCHSPQNEIGGRNIGSCGTCHQPGNFGRVSDRAKSYSVNFSHREHLSGNPMNCSSCHTVRAGSARGRQVTAPVGSMHFPPAGRVSCASCHDNKRAFGPPDFADCKRCHEGKNFRF